MSKNPKLEDDLNPLQRVEALYSELVTHYGEGDDRELRAAAKLLLVALDKFQKHGGHDWARLVDEYIRLARDNPDKFIRVLSSKPEALH